MPSFRAKVFSTITLLFLAGAIISGACAPLFAAAPVPPFLEGKGFEDGANLHAREIVCPGVIHEFDSFATGPLTINKVFVDFSRKDLMIEAEKANDKLSGGEALPKMLKRMYEPNSRPVAAINADFWSHPAGLKSVPIGLFVDEGTIWNTPHETRSVFAFDDRGNFHIGPARWSAFLRKRQSDLSIPFHQINVALDNTSITLYTWPFGRLAPAPRSNFDQIVLRLESEEWLPNAPTGAVVESRRAAGTGAPRAALDKKTYVLQIPGAAADWLTTGTAVELVALFKDLPGKVVGVTGGGPRLVENGKVCAAEAGVREDMGRNFVKDRHPRTAVGLMPGAKRVVFAVVDGRQPGRSIGINLTDFAQVMLDAGCVEAMNLDGGGSSTMMIRDQVVNFPSDAEGPRAVCNALVVRRSAPIGRLETLNIIPEGEYVLPPGAAIDLSAKGADFSGEPVSLDGFKIDWSIEKKFCDASLSPSGRLTIGEKTGDVIVEASALPTSSSLLRRTPAPPEQEWRPWDEKPTVVGGVTDIRSSSQAPEPWLRKSGKVFHVEKPSRAEAAPPALLLSSGESAPVKFRAWAGQQKMAPIASLWDVTVPPFLRYDAASGNLTAIGAGVGNVKAVIGGREAVVRVAADRYKEVLVAAMDDLPSTDTMAWIQGARYRKGDTRLTLEKANKKQGAAAWRLEYGMASGGTTKIALPVKVKLPGHPLAVGVWVFGDGKEQWLRGELRDANGVGFYLDFTHSTDGINWSDEWRFVKASLISPPAISGGSSRHPQPPFTVESLYIAQAQEAAKRDGVILLDGLAGLELPE